MKIMSGLSDGAVLQRNRDNLCRVLICGSFSGTPTSSFGKLSRKTESEWELTGIVVGGPYMITIKDDEGSQTFTDIYVGDVWLLAGQSNMEGAGRMTIEDDAYAANPDSRVRALYMDDRWDDARPQLHQLWLSRDKAHREAYQNDMESIKKRNLTILDKYPAPQRRGVGPGLYFGREMNRLTGGVPQGLIPCAVGGAPIEMWLPVSDGTENYYTAAVRRLRLVGNHIHGVFWSQGEGNSNWEGYPDLIQKIRKDLSEELDCDILPFVQVQSFRHTLDVPHESAYIWSRFREMQRRMPGILPNLATVASNDLELDDCIHLSSDSQKKVGVRAAKAMWRLISGTGYPEPELESIQIMPDCYVPHFSLLRIRYRNLYGGLRASGVPSGFTLRERGSQEDPVQTFMQRIYLEENEAVIRIELSEEELKKRELWYGWGNNFYCNITDGADRAIPAMGPISIPLQQNK